MEGIEDAFADMSKSPPESTASAPQPNGKNGANYVTLCGVKGLNAYLVKRRAEITLPLLLAIQRRLDMSRKAHTPLSSKVWEDAGSPPKNRRAAILMRLRQMPHLVAIHEDRHFTFRYRVEKGPAWRQIEKDGREGVGEEEEED
jgi:hypothetical protein